MRRRFLVLAGYKHTLAADVWLRPLVIAETDLQRTFAAVCPDNLRSHTLYESSRRRKACGYIGQWNAEVATHSLQRIADARLFQHRARIIVHVARPTRQIHGRQTLQLLHRRAEMLRR